MQAPSQTDDWEATIFLCDCIASKQSDNGVQVNVTKDTISADKHAARQTSTSRDDVEIGARELRQET